MHPSSGNQISLKQQMSKILQAQGGSGKLSASED
jgi:hypothetical protein